MSNSLNQRLVVRDRGRFQTVDLLCIERMRLGMGVIEWGTMWHVLSFPPAPFFKKTIYYPWVPPTYFYISVSTLVFLLKCIGMFVSKVLMENLNILSSKISHFFIKMLLMNKLYL